VKEAGRRVEDAERRERDRRFQRLYEAHYGAVLAYAQRRATEAADAQDIVAETFTVAWRRIDDVPDTDAALPWLYGVARRVLANQRRGGRRRADLSTRLRANSAVPVEIDADVLAADDRRIVLAALARLKEADREVLRLATWEELSHREIASIVDCSEASVAVRLHRARNRLGKEIAKEEGRAGHQGSASARRRAEGQHP
jgi:RNA polymerase sigma-70 factor (ECF subfamily)